MRYNRGDTLSRLSKAKLEWVQEAQCRGDGDRVHYLKVFSRPEIYVILILNLLVQLGPKLPSPYALEIPRISFAHSALRLEVCNIGVESGARNATYSTFVPVRVGRVLLGNTQ